MANYFTITTFKINRGISFVIESIDLSYQSTQNLISHAIPTLACSQKEPKCDKKETYYTVFDKFGNEMFTTNSGGWQLITGKGGPMVSSYILNRGISFLRNDYYFTNNAYNGFPIVKQSTACTQDDPKCEKQKPSTYYSFYNLSNKLIFTTDQRGYDSLNGGGGAAIPVEEAK